ncbi:MAG: hypothetical protein ABI852_20655 [Gemmatimonadaceae bacterium]
MATVLASCSLWPDGEFPPGGADRIDERPEYLMWWKLVESCAHVRRKMDVEWYSTNGRLIDYGDVVASGIYRPWPDRIALVDPKNGPVARHEMLHALLQEDGHPLDRFAGDCDGFVNFSPPDAYGISAKEMAEAATVRADSALTVSVTTYPEHPSLTEFGGKFVFVITATNRTGRSVWAATQTRTVYAQYRDGGSFRYQSELLPFSNVFFRPGQSRLVIVDAAVFATGTFDVVAGYGRAQSISKKLIMQP